MRNGSLVQLLCARSRVKEVGPEPVTVRWVTFILQHKWVRLSGGGRGGGLKQGPHRCSYLRRAALQPLSGCCAWNRAFCTPVKCPSWFHHWNQTGLQHVTLPLLKHFGFRFCLLCCITMNITVQLLQESFNIQTQRMHFFALIKYSAVIWRTELWKSCRF